MPQQEIPAPYLGVGDGTPFIKQPGDITDPAGMGNVAPGTTPGGHKRLETRAKLESEFDGAQGTGEVAAIGSIPRSSGVSGTQTQDIDTATTGSSREAGVFRGQCVVFDTDGSVLAVFSDTSGDAVAAPPTAAGAWPADKVCWHATDPDILYFFTIMQDATYTGVGAPAGATVVGVNRCSLLTGTITHQKRCIDKDAPYGTTGIGTNSLALNQAVQHGPYLFVAAYRYVYVFDASDLTYICRVAVAWCEEIQSLSVITVDGRDWLMALTTGQVAISGPVADDTTSADKEYFGEFYRTAITRLDIIYGDYTTKSAVGVGTAALVRHRIPMGIASGGAGYEEHYQFRIAEWTIARPRGCLAYAMACVANSAGDVFAYIARTNQGWGYNGNLAGQRPDGQAPYITACRAVLTRVFEAGELPGFIDPNNPVRIGFSEGVGGWERDNPDGSLRRGYVWNTITYQNDIPNHVSGGRNPHAEDNEPTLFAVAVDETNGRVYFAGRRPSSSAQGPTVFCLDTATGDLLWAMDTCGPLGAAFQAGFVQQNALAIDPVTGNLVVGMMRGAGWEKPDGTLSADKAELLVLSGENGQVLRSFDLTDAINVNGYITATQEYIGCFGVAVNSRGQVAAALTPNRYDV